LSAVFCIATHFCRAEVASCFSSSAFALASAVLRLGRLRRLELGVRLLHAVQVRGGLGRLLIRLGRLLVDAGLVALVLGEIELVPRGVEVGGRLLLLEHRDVVGLLRGDLFATLIDRDLRQEDVIEVAAERAGRSVLGSTASAEAERKAGRQQTCHHERTNALGSHRAETTTEAAGRATIPTL
jgi:hypothetical protein